MDYEKDFTGRKLQTKYGKIYFKHHKGTGTSLIFIHGLAASTRTWLRLMQDLPDDLDIYLMDLLGHGKSDSPELKYTMNLQVETLAALIKEENIDSPYLFGHSYGGWISAVYAKDNPTAGLILEASAGLEQFYNEVRGSAEREKYKRELLGKALTLDAKEYVVKSILDDEFVEGQLRKGDLAKIKVPTMILWGSQDNVVDIKYSKIFKSEINGSRLELINGARHTPHYTNPGEISKLLLEFIGR